MKKTLLLTIFNIVFIIVNAQWLGKDWAKVAPLPTSADLLNQLNTYYTESVKPIKNPECFKPGQNVNDSVKIKLLSLLRDYWTEEELNQIINKTQKREFEFIYLQGIIDKTVARCDYSNQLQTIDNFERINPNISRSDIYKKIFDSVYNSIYDSTVLNYRKELREAYKYRKIPDVIIKSIATANVREAIPILKHALLANNPQFNKDAVELALARFGDVELQKSLIKKYTSNFDINSNEAKRSMRDRLKVLSYISTQESVFQMNIFMDTTKREFYFSHGDQTVLLGREAVMMLLETVINKDIQNYFLIHDISPLDDPKILQYAKDWLIKNKGKYQIDHLHIYYHFR